MSPTATNVLEGGNRLRNAGIWGAPLAVLFGVWLWLVFSSGGFITRHWLLPAVVVGFFGLVVSLTAAYPRRPGQLSLAVLALFGLYSVWVALSALWADSATRVWLESSRTFVYLVVLTLALVFLTDKGARRIFRYLVMAGACTLLVVCLWKLATTDSIAGLFYNRNRFAYPVSAPNHAAALYLVFFWPLMWLAASPEEHAPVRGVALGLATGLVGLAFMTQSRGAIWTLALTLVLTFILSPARLRTLLYLVLPALLMVYIFPRLNRYWLEGADAVGGWMAVRTVLAASITAGAGGMLIALLEKWIRVSRKMKIIFGTVVLLGALAGLFYGSLAVTRDAGGPLEWAAQTWRSFTGQTAEDPAESGPSRLTLLSSTGRVGIWKVAVQEFEQSPLLGVGADNFVFQYDKLRTVETYKPHQAHSFELQVLGETGAVGGVFAFGGILLVAGGVLWPRWAAGRQGSKDAREGRRLGVTAAPQTTGSISTPGSRWGSGAVTYGWEMALLVAAAYWLIHASVDWLWQMAGVSIPAVLFVAAAAAGIDARVGMLWPRLGRLLRVRSSGLSADPDRSEEDEAAPDVVAAAQTPDEDSLFMTPRRADQHAGRSRRARRHERRRRERVSLQPPGPLSHVFRFFVTALSLVVIISAGLPYASLLYQDSAIALAGSDPEQAVERAGAALTLMPTDPEPYVTQASIYRRAAMDAVASDDDDKTGAVLDDLALAVAAYDKAVTLEPADWTLRLHAGVATMELLLATGYVERWSFDFAYGDLAPHLTGLADWSDLALVPPGAPATGSAQGSLAVDEETRAAADRYRVMGQDGLVAKAKALLDDAKERNPLAVQIDEAVLKLAMIAGQEDETER